MPVEEEANLSIEKDDLKATTWVLCPLQEMDCCLVKPKVQVVKCWVSIEMES
jgi:hypothetical protein